MFRGVSSDGAARQELLDTFSRQVEPSTFLTKERMERWSAADGSTV
jgi:hypothetical protein